ncbi:glycosyltransferase family 4 protein [Kaistia geumhonensis]|nr:glycosyltransferase family 4 protein [Kaistia geumhonensis]MCX5480716.1 glycosyltransferase family 4 protein [Kaistia geumhonensis]
MLPAGRASASRANAGSVAVAVRHYVAGGREHGGGIGRLVGYVVDAAAASGVQHAVTDTRGPRWFAPVSVMRLVLAIVAMTSDRVQAPGRIHHIHVAGRGSTRRKLLLAAAARALGCRHILHLHDYDYADDFASRPPALQSSIRRMFQGADRVIALGLRDEKTLAGLIGVDAARLTILRNCVPDPGDTVRDRGRQPVILFLGRLGTRKGVPELLQALASPVMARLQWRAVIAGDGPVDEYRHRAAALGLAKRTSFPGWLGVEATRALCREAAILVLPSRAEGLAMAVIEGMAHGLAVVTTRVGAHEEAVSDGETGLFVPVGDPEALAEALALLVRDEALRTRLGEAARRKFLADFSIQSYLSSLECLYETVKHR